MTTLTDDFYIRCMEHEDYIPFEKALADLVNLYSKENDTNTPDFLLADYLNRCLENYKTISRAREGWYGYRMEPARIGGCCVPITDEDDVSKAVVLGKPDKL